MCPSQTRLESEIIAMTLDMLNGQAVHDRDPDRTACGVINSGGTESIISALLAHRNKFRDERNITKPEMILPDTAHPAFRKGAHYFRIKIIHAPTDPQTTQVALDFVSDHINQNTILLVGSAGNYPYGTIDPIGRLSDLALKYNIPVTIAGIQGFEGQIISIIPRKTTCYRCIFGDVPKKKKQEPIAVISPTCGVVGSLEANEVLKGLLNRGNRLINQILIIELENSDFNKIPIRINQNCICQKM